VEVILEGERPEKPTFDTTRGYTEKLWEMTTSCWEGDPSDRPTVDHVLDVLRSGAEQWESEHGEIDAPSPVDDRGSAPLTERLDLSTFSKHENEPATTTSASPNSPRSPVTETLVPALSPLVLVPTPSVLSPSATKNKASQIPIPPTPSKEEILSVSHSPLKKGEPEPTPTTLEEMEHPRSSTATLREEKPKDKTLLRPAWEGGKPEPYPMV